MIKLKNASINILNYNILENISIEIPDNKITVIVGPNGIGKTTLLKTMAGKHYIKTGRMESDFKSVFYLSQKISYPKNITLFEYIESTFYKDNWSWFISKNDKNKIERVIEILSLQEKSNIYIDNLSSGELQKANIALALVSNSDILLLDEPTSNIDLVNQVKILELLRTLIKQGLTVVLVLHDLNLAASYGDYFIGLTKKHNVVSGDRQTFFTAENLNEIFGINFKVIQNENEFNIQVMHN